jgi:hypothetical protein
MGSAGVYLQFLLQKMFFLTFPGSYYAKYPRRMQNIR